jgi:hypothetical protein
LNKVYTGLPLTGKTTHLINCYRHLVQEGIPTDFILVLVRDSNQVSRWRLALDLRLAGRLNIYTYWGFIEAEINRYWKWVENSIYRIPGPARPTFINAEIAHYLISTLISRLRGNGMFDAVVATPFQIGIQVLNNLNLAVTSGLGVEESFRRLQAFYESENDKRAAFADSVEVVKQYRQILLESRCIDYSLAVELYNTVLLPDPRYQTILKKKLKAMVVDNLEESLPVQVDLVNKLLPHLKHAYMSFDPTGGHTSYFGADPRYAWDQLQGKLKICELESGPDCPAEAIELATAVKENILQGNPVKQVVVKNLRVNVMAKDFRSESILDLSEQVAKLVGSGCPPGEVIIVAPVIDRVLDITLTSQLREKGIPLESLNRKQYLADEEFAQVMVTLAAIIQGQDQVLVNQSELARTLGMLLGLDPVRSQLLARYCRKNGVTKTLPPEIISRIGFASLNRYQELVQWTESKREQGLDEDILFQQLFAEMTAPLIHHYEDIITSRQIINSALRYKRAYDQVTGLGERPFLEGFMDMIHQGTVAADVIRMREIDPDAVILATPGAFFKSNRAFAHQFWLDCSSENWFPRSLRELNNPHLLSRSWQGEWKGEIAARQQLEDAARMAAGLIYRSRASITLMVSEYNSLGLEQEGHLHELVMESVVAP